MSTSSGGAGPTEAEQAAPARRRSSRDALIAAALAEFSERGYEATTVTDVAERAGVTTGALYAHFRSKLDLLLQALGLTPTREVLRELAEVAAQPAPRISELLGKGMAASPAPATLLLLDAIVAGRRDPDVAQTLREGLRAYESTMAEATRAGVELGLLDTGLQAEDLARVLILLAVGRLVVEAVGATPPSAEGYARLAEVLLQAADDDGEPDASVALAQVRSRARALDRARDDLAQRVVAAVDAGHSLRKVGAAAGVSHERIRQILRRMRQED